MITLKNCLRGEDAFRGFKQTLMCEWLGEALAEDALRDYGSGGGFWRLLGFYKRQAIVEDQKIKDIGTTGEELAESNVSSVKEEIAEVEISEGFRKITVAEDGTITIPVAACRSPRNGEKIRFMESIDGGMQAHYGIAGSRPELLSYTIDIPKAGKYEFTAHVCSVTMDRYSCLASTVHQVGTYQNGCSTIERFGGNPPKKPETSPTIAQPVNARETMRAITSRKRTQ